MAISDSHVWAIGFAALVLASFVVLYFAMKVISRGGRVPSPDAQMKPNVPASAPDQDHELARVDMESEVAQVRADLDPTQDQVTDFAPIEESGYSVAGRDKLKPKLLLVLSAGKRPEIVEAESGNSFSEHEVEIVDLDNLVPARTSEAVRRYLAAQAARLRDEIHKKEEMIRTWQDQVAGTKRILEKLGSTPSVGSPAMAKQR
jgi:hypothetical protein